MMTYEELAQEWQRKLQENPEEVLEAEYRRGYCDGFVQAVNAMADLFAHRLSRQRVIDCLYDFWEQDLMDWRQGDCTREIWPPEPKCPRR